MTLYYLIPLAGYLIGSISFASLIARFHGVDLRSVGSGNPGATNVGRCLGKPWGYLCFVLDVLKGFGPTFAAGLLLQTSGNIPSTESQLIWVATAAGCLLGHIFSCFLRFRGGKGVATALGMLLGIWPYLALPGLAALATWLLVVVWTRYVSLASMVGALIATISFAPINAWLNGWDSVLELWPLFTAVASMALLVIVRHRSNLQRILAGTENKIRLRGSKSSA